jgi:hypothetical protein
MMMTSSVAIASAGWLVFSCSAYAQSAAYDEADLLAPSMREANAMDVTTIPFSRRKDDADNWKERSTYSHAGSADKVASYGLFESGERSLVGYIGFSGKVAPRLHASDMHRIAGVDNTDALLDSRWLEPDGSSPGLTVGYGWRDLKLEGAAFSGRTQKELQSGRHESLKLDSRSTRLSFKPSPDWTFQVSRRALMELDQVVSNGEVRRTAISATYNRAFDNGNWQTTLAWGRNTRKFREPTMGYLLESTLRLRNTHAVFGRLEQVGSDELQRVNESLQRSMFKLNKLTVGYYHEIQYEGSLGFDIGAFVSRPFIPSSMALSYGSAPVSYMMFIRLRLQ